MALSTYKNYEGNFLNHWEIVRSTECKNILAENPSRDHYGYILVSPALYRNIIKLKIQFSFRFVVSIASQGPFFSS